MRAKVDKLQIIAQDLYNAIQNGQKADDERKIQQWADQEHSLYLRGIEQFGRAAHQKIADLIQTKSVRQVISHSQKFFLKLERHYQKSEAVKLSLLQKDKLVETFRNL